MLGLASPVVLGLITLLVSLLRPEYNHLTQAFSELGEFGAPYYFLFNIIGFLLVGLMNIQFSRYVTFYLEAQRVRKTGGDLLVVSSVVWILTGIFPLSYTIDWLYWTHFVFAFCTYVFGGLAVLVLGTDLTKIEGFGVLGLISVAFSFLIWGSVATLTVSQELAQLLSITFYFLWQSLLGVGLYRFHLKPNLNKSLTT